MVLRDDVFYTYEEFPNEIWGIVYYCTEGHYHIGINKNLTIEKQKEVLQHELNHIKNDCTTNNYIIGMDMQYSELETG